MKKGITLIALIITIIVLLILAGVSIALVIGDNGILNKAQSSKTKTLIGDVKDASEIIRGEYEINHEGKNPTARFIIEELINQGKINISQVEDYGDDTGIGVIVVEGEQVTIIGSNSINMKIKGAFYSLNYSKLYILDYDGNLYSIYKEKTVDDTELLSVDLTSAIQVASNIKELYNEAYLTNDNELYIYGYEIDEFYKKADNVKKVYPNKEMSYISNNNELFFFNWSDPVDNQYEKYADNVKEYFGNYSYATFDGYANIRLNINGSMKTIDDEIVYFYNGYYINSLGELYKESSTVVGEFNKVADNVKETNGHGYYLTNDGLLYYNNDLIGENVKKWNGMSYYINSSDEYYGEGEKRADNVKDIGNSIYVTNDNKLYDDGWPIGLLDDSYDVLDYCIDNNQVWFVTTSNEFFYIVMAVL